MGYTHYWTSLGEVGDEKWTQFTRIVQPTLDRGYKAGIIQWESDNTDPPSCFNTVRFNGVGDDGHETFLMDREGGRGFCKTARKPYDAYVGTVLMVAAIMFGDQINVTSDGDENDWGAVFDVAQVAYGFDVHSAAAKKGLIL